MTDDPRRRHLTPEEAAELRRQARQRRGYPVEPSRRPVPSDDRDRRERGPLDPSRRPAPGDDPRVPRFGGRPGDPYDPREPYDPRPRVDPREPVDPYGARPHTAPREPFDPRDPRGDRDPRGARSRRDLRPSRRTGHPSSRPARVRTPRRRRIRPLRLVALVLVLLLTLGVVAVVWADGKLTRIDALTSYDGRPKATKGTVTLLVGTDGRDGLTPEQQRQLSTGSEQDAGGKRTDSMMLAYSPADGSSPMLVSLPRDLLVTIPGHGEAKLNAAYAYGGPQLLVQTLETSSRVRIDHYAEIGFGGFAGIVDAIGGVDLCVAQPMDDPDAGINLAPGCQTLTGPQALGFVRSRHVFAEQDLQRVRNQRQFLGALMKKAASPGVLLNPFASLPLLDEGSKALTVDSGDHVWDVARLMWTLKSSPTTTTVPHDGEGSGDVGSYLQWGPSTEAFFEAMRQGRTPPKELLTDGG